MVIAILRTNQPTTINCIALLCSYRVFSNSNFKTLNSSNTQSFQIDSLWMRCITYDFLCIQSACLPRHRICASVRLKFYQKKKLTQKWNFNKLCGICSALLSSNGIVILSSFGIKTPCSVYKISCLCFVSKLKIKQWRLVKLQTHTLTHTHTFRIGVCHRTETQKCYTH